MASGVERSRSVSSIRKMYWPPRCRAYSQQNNAVRNPPMCRKPVGLGANRVRTVMDLDLRKLRGAEFSRGPGGARTTPRNPGAPFVLTMGRCHTLPLKRAVSSAVEHCFHTAGVTGSIPVPPTTEPLSAAPIALGTSESCTVMSPGDSRRQVHAFNGRRDFQQRTNVHTVDFTAK